jgi:hypothetical protein
MKKLASVCGLLAIVGSSVSGNAPAVEAQSCNYYASISVTGQKVNLDTCSISRETQESNTEDRLIAQANERSLNYYEDNLIKARGLSASFDQTKRYLTVNVMIENKSGKTLILGNVHKYYNDATVNSDSGESAECLLRGINGVGVEQTNPLRFSVLKPKGRVNVSVYQCGNITASATKSVGVTIPLVEYTKEKNNPFTVSLEGIPVKQISNR